MKGCDQEIGKKNTKNKTYESILKLTEISIN